MNSIPLDLLQRKVDEGAIDTVLAAFPDLHLVCASPKDFDRSERDLIAKLGLAGRCPRLSPTVCRRRIWWWPRCSAVTGISKAASIRW